MKRLPMLDYNTRLVVLCAGLLGVIAGMVGVYLILRKRSLIGDAICHAALPGLAVSFLIQVAWGGDGKNLGWLMLGAAISGTVGSLAILCLRQWTNLKEDAALGIVLSVFFGMSMVLFSLVQQLPKGNAAGLENYILGKTASIVAMDAYVLSAAALLVIGLLFVFRKELQLLCFDSSAAMAQGWPVLAIDLILLSSVLVVVIVGANIVGVILVIALLVIPPASARFWTHSLTKTIVISGGVGALSGIVGSLSSLLLDKVPSGAAIVLAASGCFAFSLLFGSERGFVWRFWSLRIQRWKMDQEHVLRAIYELLESKGMPPKLQAQVRSQPVQPSELGRMRTWKSNRLRSAIRRVRNAGWVTINQEGAAMLTASGIQQSMRAVRRHRLLELYFSRWADLSPDAIDRGADYTEHALDDDMLAQLESDTIVSGDSIELPKSLHPL
jgi:manganese/zinc/iron transport system permease protein